MRLSCGKKKFCNTMYLHLKSNIVIVYLIKLLKIVGICGPVRYYKNTLTKHNTA